MWAIPRWMHRASRFEPVSLATIHQPLSTDFRHRMLLHEAPNVHERAIDRPFADQPVALPRLYAKDVEPPVDPLELGGRTDRRAHTSGRAMRDIDVRAHGGLAVFLERDRGLVTRVLHPADHIRRRQNGRENVAMVLEGVLRFDLARDLCAR